ncbi:MAG: phosphate-starvation-inducible PsiE family protein [Gammaproteobacteria bacterium]|nr:phosphate-starvation-inducible PsiE family protein [Gammaproteobacteria bacterium]MCP5136463.1 phosphate-starvation-inducible PsiE family protein [Gammaproteobacteria bacterium]
MTEKVFEPVKRAGILFSEIFHYILLFVAGIVILWATIDEVGVILSHSSPTLKDILMLFIFLELGAMIGIYFKTNRLSVRFLVYVAITAITRVLVIDIKSMDKWMIITMTSAIVMLTLSVFLLRACEGWFGHDKDEQD